MNYYYDPQVAAQVAAYVNYICPVQGAKEAMGAIHPELVDNPLIFPDDATLAKVKRVPHPQRPTRRRSTGQQFQSAIGN